MWKTTIKAKYPEAQMNTHNGLKGDNPTGRMKTKWKRLPSQNLT